MIKFHMDCFDLCFQDIEAQLQQESDTARENVSSLEDNLNEEKQRREDVEQELLRQKKVGWY